MRFESRTLRTPQAIIAVALALALALAMPPVSAFAKSPPVYTGLVKGVAVGGYDPVAYFTDGKAVPGTAGISLEHEGVTWHFASTANRDAFKADPGKYAPRFGGYCALAVSQGYIAKGDPEAWSIVDGKLYLNYSKMVRRAWEKDKSALIRKGDANWPKVLEK